MSAKEREQAIDLLENLGRSRIAFAVPARSTPGGDSNTAVLGCECQPGILFSLLFRPNHGGGAGQRAKGLLVTKRIQA